MSLENIPVKSLKDVTSYLSRGVTPSYTEDNGVAVINQRCIRDNKIIWENIRLTDPYKKKISSEKYIKQYDVLVNSTGTGTLGRSAQVKEIFSSVTVDSHVTILRPNDLVDPLFFGYAVNMVEKNIENLAEGSTGQTELSRTRLGEEIFINLHSKDIQKKIAYILSNIDKKIELNEKINNNLENILKHTFFNWFVKFDGYGSDLKNSEIGTVPNNWNVFPLGKLVKVIDNRGKTPPLVEDNYEFPIIDVRALSGENRIVDFKKCSKYVSQKTYDNWFRSGHPQEYDILISTVGTIAELKLFLGSKGCLAQNVVAFRSKKEHSLYLYQYLKYIKKDLEAYNIGSVQPSIKVTHLLKHPILIPDEDTLNSFNEFSLNITKILYDNYLEIENLSRLRDNLLPKLMSGEIDVSKINYDLIIETFYFCFEIIF